MHAETETGLSATPRRRPPEHRRSGNKALYDPWIDPDRGSRPFAVEEMEICVMERHYDVLRNADRGLS